MIDVTHSSNSGHGICCNPTDNTTKCGFDLYENLYCGPPVERNDTIIEQEPAIT